MNSFLKGFKVALTSRDVWIRSLLIFPVICLIGWAMAYFNNAHAAGIPCVSCHSTQDGFEPVIFEYDVKTPAVGVYGEPDFQEAVSIDTLPTREMVFTYDRDYDGVPDYEIYRAIQDFIPAGPVFRDYDPKYILVPKDGYYRVLLEPNRARGSPGFTPVAERLK